MLGLLRKHQGTEKLPADHERRIKELDAEMATPKRPAGPPDPGHVHHEGADSEDLALHFHQDVAARIGFAPIWRRSAFPGQQVDKTHVLHDEEVVEIHAP